MVDGNNESARQLSVLLAGIATAFGLIVVLAFLDAIPGRELSQRVRTAFTLFISLYKSGAMHRSFVALNLCMNVYLHETIYQATKRPYTWILKDWRRIRARIKTSLCGTCLYITTKVRTAKIYSKGAVPELVEHLSGIDQDFVQLSSLDMLTKSCMGFTHGWRKN